jgi:hypothetical protein
LSIRHPSGERTPGITPGITGRLLAQKSRLLRGELFFGQDSLVPERSELRQLLGHIQRRRGRLVDYLIGCLLPVAGILTPGDAWELGR